MSYDGTAVEDEIGGLDDQGLDLRRRRLLAPGQRQRGLTRTAISDIPEAPPVTRARPATASDDERDMSAPGVRTSQSIGSPINAQNRRLEESAGGLSEAPAVRPADQAGLRLSSSLAASPETASGVAPAVSVGGPIAPAGIAPLPRPAEPTQSSAIGSVLTPPRPEAIGQPLQLSPAPYQRPNYREYEDLLRNPERRAGVEKIQGFKGGSAPDARRDRWRGLPWPDGVDSRYEAPSPSRTRARSYRSGRREPRDHFARGRARERSDDCGKRSPDGTERTGNPEADAYYSLIDAGKTPQEALEMVKGAGKQDRPAHSTAFEAFAYGTPEEKQSAKDFLDYERRIGAKYRTPNEFDLRYKLYREDPDTYKAMFGDKGEAADERARVADRAHATRMLNFFEKQRGEIDKNYTLDENEKRQKLQEIDALEKPFKDAVEEPAAGGGGGGGKGDRVSVVSPDGTPGTVPRSQLPAAKKKGYRVAQ